ncbi:MAG: ComEC/Rec2 family competence protein [Patescibacteria group bacterium]
METRGTKWALAVLAVVCIGVLFFLRVDWFLRAERAQTIPAAAMNRTVTVEGVVVNDPEARETSLHAVVAVETINTTPARGKILAILPRGTAFAYNDRVSIEGTLTAPDSFVTDTGRVFDYPNYLRVRGISGIVRYAEVNSVEHGGATVYGSLYQLKHAFERSIERVLFEPQTSLFEGILLGERRGLPDSLTNAFIIASLIHIVVLSGYNISIVGEAVLRGMTFLPRKASYIIGGILMLLFVLMTGASSTSIRAGIMAVIAIVARYLHRPTAALRALGIAAAAMVFWNPLIVLYDASFILSIIATFGLIVLGRVVEERLMRVPAWSYFNLRSIAASTIAVQIFILPALLYFTGILSFVALPANILVLPVVSLTMLAGFIAGLLGMIHAALAFVPAFVTDTLLRYMIAVANTASSLPFSSVTIPAFPAWFALVVYVPLSWAALLLYNRSTKLRHQESA